MSAKGFYYDNACAESFFASLKKDKLYGRRFKTRNEARIAIVEYIELFYNPRRIHSTLGYKSPKEYKRDYYSNQKLAAQFKNMLYIKLVQHTLKLHIFELIQIS